MAENVVRERFEESLLKGDEILGLDAERKALRELFDLYITGERDCAWGLWPLLGLALWVDKFYHLIEVRMNGKLWWDMRKGIRDHFILFLNAINRMKLFL